MSPSYISMPRVVIVQVLFGQPYCWGSIGEASLSFLGDNLIVDFTVLWLAQSFYPSSVIFREPQV